MQLKAYLLISPAIESGTVLKALETAISAEEIEKAITDTESNEERKPAASVGEREGGKQVLHRVKQSAEHVSRLTTIISLEMIFRGLYYFSVANDQGKADNPIKYFATPENQDLGVVKYLRKPVSRLDLSPFPAPSSK